MTRMVRVTLAVASLVSVGGCATATPGVAPAATATPVPTVTGAADGEAVVANNVEGSQPVAPSSTAVDTVVNTTVGTAASPPSPPVRPAPAPSPAPSPSPAPTPAPSPTTQPAATAPSTTAPTGPRMLLVVLASHPNWGACPQPGVQVELTFTWQSAGTEHVAVQRPDGAYLVKHGPAASSITFTHTCAAMPSLYRFIPFTADGTAGPPWNFNV